MDLKAELGNEAEAMLKHVEAETTSSAPSTLEIPASCYTSKEYFDAEMENIFLKLPILTALSAEMPNNGDYKAMELMGKPIIVTRDKNGDVNCMMNVCAHRGMKLVDDGHGNAKRFTCPYHAWVYQNTGKLQGVAEANTFGDVCKEKRSLTMLPCEERAGFIWVILTPGETMDLDAHLGEMIPDLERYDLSKWHYCGSRTIHGANWKIAYDGYLEGYHFAAAHPETIHARSFSNRMTFRAEGPHLRVGYPQNTIVEDLAKVPREDWGDQENTGFDFVRTIFPNISIFFAPEITQVAQLIPGPTPDQNTTHLMFIRSTPPKDDEDLAGIEGMMDWLRDVVDVEDYHVGLKVQKGMESGALKSVIFGKNERGNQYFHKYIDYFVSKDPNKKPPVL